MPATTNPSATPYQSWCALSAQDDAVIDAAMVETTARYGTLAFGRPRGHQA